MENARMVKNYPVILLVYNTVDNKIDEDKYIDAFIIIKQMIDFCIDFYNFFSEKSYELEKMYVELFPLNTETQDINAVQEQVRSIINSNVYSFLEKKIDKIERESNEMVKHFLPKAEIILDPETFENLVLQNASFYLDVGFDMESTPELKNFYRELEFLEKNINNISEDYKDRLLSILQDIIDNYMLITKIDVPKKDLSKLSEEERKKFLDIINSDNIWKFTVLGVVDYFILKHVIQNLNYIYNSIKNKIKKLHKMQIETAKAYAQELKEAKKKGMTLEEYRKYKQRKKKTGSYVGALISDGIKSIGNFLTRELGIKPDPLQSLFYKGLDFAVDNLVIAPLILNSKDKEKAYKSVEKMAEFRRAFGHETNHLDRMKNYLRDVYDVRWSSWRREYRKADLDNEAKRITGDPDATFDSLPKELQILVEQSIKSRDAMAKAAMSIIKNQKALLETKESLEQMQSGTKPSGSNQNKKGPSSSKAKKSSSGKPKSGAKQGTGQSGQGGQPKINKPKQNAYQNNPFII
ncbi:MAG: hypothetical protein QXF12_02790 [Candidatus Aenigmatarchaeota archaeon]